MLYIYIYNLRRLRTTMNTYIILSKLISIANISKTDIAMSLAISPSTLSRILAGTNFPQKRDIKYFSIEFSSIIAEKIYDFHCYLKLKDIFPFIYDFKSCNELQMFLENAIEYSFLDDYERIDYTGYSEQNNLNQKNNFCEKSFTNTQKSFNIFCVIMSNLLINVYETEYNVYTNFPIFDNTSFFPFDRVRVLSKRNTKMVLNITGNFDNYGLDETHNIGSLISQLTFWEDIVNLRLFQSQNKITSPNYYLLAENNFLLSLNNIDNTYNTIFSYIKNYTFISTFEKTIIDDFTLPRTINLRDSNKIPDNTNDFINSISALPITLLSNCPLNYYDNKVDFSQMKNQNILLLQVLIQKSNIQFEQYISENYLSTLFNNKRTHLPFIGEISWNSYEKNEYFLRISKSINSTDNLVCFNRNNSIPDCPIICLKNLSILYVNNSNLNRFKIHYFHSNQIEIYIKDLIDKDNSNNMIISTNDWIKYLISNYFDKY